MNTQNEKISLEKRHPITSPTGHLKAMADYVIDQDEATAGYVLANNNIKNLNISPKSPNQRLDNAGGFIGFAGHTSATELYSISNNKVTAEFIIDGDSHGGAIGSTAGSSGTFQVVDNIIYEYNYYMKYI